MRTFVLATMLLVGLSIGVAPGALGAQDSFACSVEDGVVSWSDQGADRYFVREVNNGDDSFLGRVNAGDPLSFPVDGTADSYIVRFRVGGVISEATCALGVLDPGTFSCSVADGVLSWTDQGADQYFVREVNGVEDSFVGRSESLSFPVDGTADSYIVRFRVGGVINDANCVPDGPDSDGDGVTDALDNCPLIANPDQEQSLRHIADLVGNSGDACLDIDDDGVLDLTQEHICIVIWDSGEAAAITLIDAPFSEAQCFIAEPETGTNTVIAIGDAAEADVLVGNDNTAIAIGLGAFADATNGEGNVAFAKGFQAQASAGFGNDNTARAIGDRAVVSGGIGNNNTITASGDGARARSFDGDNNTATATGDGSEALVDTGDDNSAVAVGPNAFARVISGTNSIATATSTGTSSATAVASFGDNNAAVATASGLNGVADALASMGNNNTATATSTGDGTASAQATRGDNNTATASASADGDGFASAGGLNNFVSSDNTACAGPTGTAVARAGGFTVFEQCDLDGDGVPDTP